MSLQAAVSGRSRASSGVLLKSLGGTLIVLAALIAAVIVSGVSVDAATYTMTGTLPVVNWSDPTRWTGGPAGTYPGQTAPGDTAIVNSGGFTMNMDVAPFPMIVNFNSNFPIQIPAGGALTLQASSTATTGNTITVNGGTFGIDTGANFPALQTPVTLNSGTFNNQGTVAFGVSAPFTFNGGTVLGGGLSNVVTIPSGGTAAFSGSNAPMNINNVTFIVSGTATYSAPFNGLLVNNGGKLQIDPGASLQISTSAPLTSDFVGSPVITNSGTILNTSAGTATIQVDTTSAGTIDPGSGTLVFSGTTANAGTINLSSGSSLVRFAGNTNMIGSANVTGSVGTIELQAGTMSIFVPFSVPTFKQTGGLLTGAGLFQVTNAFDWSGGQQAGTGGTQLNASTVTINPASVNVVLAGRTMTGSGNKNYAPTGTGAMGFTSNAQFNSTGGTFDLKSDNTILSDGSATAINVSAGTLTKTVGTKTTVNAAVNVTGTASLVPSGTSGSTIAFAGGGVIGGTSVTVNTLTPNARVEFSGGTTALNSGVTFNSGDLIISNSGTLSVNTSNGISTLQQSGGTLTGAQNLLIGQLTWTGGSMTGTGTTQVNTTGAINGGATTLSGRTLTNNGTIQYAPSAPLAINSGGQVQNSGTWQFGNSTAITSDLTLSPKFANNNIVSKTVGGATSIFVPFLQAGTMTLSGGSTLQMLGGGQDNGGTTNTSVAGDSLEILSAYNFAAAPIFTGPGFVKVGFGGTLSVNATSTLANFELSNGGTLGGSFTLNISNALKWTGGTMNGGGITNLTGGTGDMTALTASPQLNNRSFTSAGTINYAPIFPIMFTGNAAWTNLLAGTMNINANGMISSSGAGNAFANAGSIYKTGGVGPFAFNLTFNSSGIVEAQGAGSYFAFNGGGNMNGGAIRGSVANSGATFDAGSFNINGGNFGTLSTIKVNGGTLNILSAQNAPAQFNLISGGITGGGANTLTFPSGTAGNFSGGSITSLALLSLSGSSMAFDTSTSAVTLNSATPWFNTGANGTWTGGNPLALDGASALTNQGTFTITGGGTMSTTGGGSVINTGTFAKSAGGPTTIATAFDNSGTVNVTSGTLSFGGGGTDSGQYTSSAGTTIAFTGGTRTLTAASAIAAGAAGTTTIAGANLTTAGTFTPAGPVSISSGSLTLNTSTPSSITGLTMNGGTLSGSAALQLAGTNTWSAGTITGSGSLALAAGGTLDIISGLGALLDGRSLTNAATMHLMSGGSLTLNNAATLTNQAGSTFDFQGDGSILNTAGPAFVTNAGTFLKTCCAGTSFVGGVFTNTGAVNAQAGTLNFASFGQAAGTTNLAGGNLQSSSALSFTGGTLTGNGQIAASVTNGGATISPNGALTLIPGVITITGNFTQTSGTFLAELAGNGSNDRLSVTGTANLGGNLNVQLISPYVPANGDTFNVLSSAGLTDTAAKSYPAFGQNNTGYFIVNPSPTNLVLQAVIPMADLTVNGITAPASVVHTQPWTVTIPVTNFGSATANNVQVTVTATNGTFVSATVTSGTCSANVCTIATLGNGATETVTAIITATTLPTVTANASVTANEVDPDSTNNNASVSAAVQPSADLSLAIADSPDPVFAGTTLTYTATVTNAGPDAAAASVVLTLTGASYGALPGGCVNSGPNAITCTLASVAPAGNASVIVNITAPGIGPVSLSGTVTPSVAADLNGGNNTASQSTTVTPKADLSITKTGPATVGSGANVSYTITVSNSGPSDAASVQVSDVTPAGFTLVSVSGACTSFPCALGTLTVGQSASMVATYTAAVVNSPVAITNTASVSSPTADPSATNNSSSATTTISANADVFVTSHAPSSASPGDTIQVVVKVGNNGPSAAAGVILTENSSSVLIFVSNSGACSTPFPCNLGTINTSQVLTINSTWKVKDPTTVGSANAQFSASTTTPDSNLANNSDASTISLIPAVDCNRPAPQLIAPINTTASSPVTFSWTPTEGATLYTVRNAAGDSLIGTSTSTSLADITIPEGPMTWYVTADVPSCGAIRSANATFNVCTVPATPVAGVVAQTTTGQTFNVQWESVNGAVGYELEEATNAAFTGATMTPVPQPAQPGTIMVAFLKNTDHATAFFYRVRAKSLCTNVFSAYSEVVRVVVLPPAVEKYPSVSAPAGSTSVVVTTLFVPGIDDGVTHTFTATVDKPWLFVDPSSGILPPQGITLQIKTNPTDLPNGTHTGTVIVTISSNTPGLFSASGTTVVSIPVSVNLVTPVIPSTKDLPPANAFIVPAVGHLDAANSRWQSDIRLANTGDLPMEYTLKFTPSDPTAGGVKSTNIKVSAGETTALDDLVRNWYGVGTLGESTNGVLEIRQKSDGKAGTPSVSAVTVVSSRTYNASSNGTLGQFVPAIPFSSFIGKAAPSATADVLSLQQISQSAQARTNLGLVEASGQPASLLITVFDASGRKLKDVPLAMRGGEQVQLNSFLASAGAAPLADGRIEVKVTSGEGKVTAYASVVDNQTLDPLLVSGVKLGAASANRYVVPGVADLNSGAATWKTDLRIFNGGTAPQNTTVTFFRDGASPLSKSVLVNPGEIRALDGIVQSLFGVTGAGGAVHVSTASNSNLVVSGRTYNATSGGTFGQFIPAVTEAEAAANGGRALQILQVEDSVRYRTNIGVAEVSGKPVSVDVSITIPDSKITPIVHFDLGANEFKQFNPFRALNLENVYNARVSVKVTGGEGRLAAYGSVVDMQTNDPTYVPAQ
jgi:uncharacterized repeat protein (TIGR01451 family)